jgi:thymidylate synthase
MINNWPILYRDVLLKGNLDSCVGVCSLWTQREIVQKIINDAGRYAVIGNLYSAQGINAMIRNIMANPRIRYVVLWGAELSLSGHSLLQLIKNGLDSNRQIIGGRGEIEAEIPAAAVDQFRRAVEVIDLRGRRADLLVKTLKTLPPKPPFANKARVFAPAKVVTRILPSEKVGFRVEAKTCAQTWLKILNLIDKYGLVKPSRYSQKNEIREVLNLTAVVTEENPKRVYFPAYLPFSATELQAYYAEFLTARQFPGTAYNYGHRLRQHFGVDQIQKIKDLIKARPDSKKMLAVTTDVKLDWSRANQGDTPCLTQILGSVYDHRFYLTAHFRSQDMVHGWPRNALALRQLQADIAKDSGYKLGPLTLITHSAHIYSDDFILVKDILAKHYDRELGFSPAVHFEFDPRGNVVVEVVKMPKNKTWPEPTPLAVSRGLKKVKDKGRMIRATLFAPNGGAAVKVFEGRTAQEVAWQMTDDGYLQLPAHAMYVGMELQRAEAAIINHKPYSQDPA